MSLRCATLTRSELEGGISALVELDARVRAAHGPDFVDDAWGEVHFRRDLPLKWQLSQWVVDAKGRALAFWVASQPLRQEGSPALVGVYSHRVCVDPDWQGRGLARRLFERLLKEATALQAGCLSLSLGESNRAAFEVYRRFGFEPLEGQRLNLFLARRPGNFVVTGDTYLEEGGSFAKRVLWRALP